MADENAEMDENSMQDEAMEETNYKVESIVGQRSKKGKKQYRVRWVGFGSDADTWEPLRNLRGCDAKIAAFEKQRAADKKVDDQSEDDVDDPASSHMDADVEPAKKKNKRKKRAVGYVYVSTDDEEADTLKDKFWRDLDAGKLDLAQGGTDDIYSGIKSTGRTARSAFLNAARRITGSGGAEDVAVAIGGASASGGTQKVKRNLPRGARRPRGGQAGRGNKSGDESSSEYDDENSKSTIDSAISATTPHALSSAGRKGKKGSKITSKSAVVNSTKVKGGAKGKGRTASIKKGGKKSTAGKDDDASTAGEIPDGSIVEDIDLSAMGGEEESGGEGSVAAMPGGVLGEKIGLEGEEGASPVNKHVDHCIEFIVSEASLGYLQELSAGASNPKRIKQRQASASKLAAYAASELKSEQEADTDDEGSGDDEITDVVEGSHQGASKFHVSQRASGKITQRDAATNDIAKGEGKGEALLVEDNLIGNASELRDKVKDDGTLAMDDKALDSRAVRGGNARGRHTRKPGRGAARSTHFSVDSLSDGEPKLVIDDLSPASPVVAEPRLTGRRRRRISSSSSEGEGDSGSASDGATKGEGAMPAIEACDKSGVVGEGGEESNSVEGGNKGKNEDGEGEEEQGALVFELEAIELSDLKEKEECGTVLILEGSPLATANAELKTAVHARDCHKVRTLLRSYGTLDVEQPEETSGQTLVMTAAEHDNTQILEQLLLHDAELDARRKDATTALMLAAQQGRQGAVNMLLYAGALINAQDNLLETALNKAIKKGHYSIVLSLLHHGVNIGQGAGDKIAIACARIHKNQRIIDLLISHRSRLQSALAAQIEIELNGAAKLGAPVFAIQCFRLCDGSRFSVDFMHGLQPTTAKGGMLLFVGHGKVSLHQAACRLDGDCLVTGVRLNGDPLHALSPGGPFILPLGPLNDGHNQLEISTVPTSKENYEMQLIVWALNLHLI